MKARLATILLAIALIASCSGSDDDGDATTATASSSPTAEDSPETAGGEQKSSSKPKSCSISDADIATFSRDWGRVAGAVGRPDLRKYTSPMVDQVEDLASRAEKCPGASHAAELPGLITRIDEGARKENVDLDDVNDFQRAGNAWLEDLGYGEAALPTG